VPASAVTPFFERFGFKDKFWLDLFSGRSNSFTGYYYLCLFFISMSWTGIRYPITYDLMVG